MKRFISFCLILLIFLSNNSITVFANSNAETDVIHQKIEKLKVKQKATEEHYSKALEKIDIAIDQYQDTFNNKSEKYKSINELKVRKTIKTAKRKKLKIISLVNDKLKEDLKKDITAELGITAILVEPNYLFELQGTNTTNDPAFNKQWGLKNILGNQAYAPLVYDGEKVTVAVIDTGIDFSSTDLQQTKWKRKICYDENNKKIPEGCLNGGYDFVDNDTNPYPSDNFTHGTSVASVIAAQTNNSASMSSIANNNVEIMSLRACCGATSFFGADNIAKSIYFAANNDAKIINASFGGPSHSKVIEDAIKYAQDKGVIVVAAAGNYSSNNDITPLYPANYNLDNIISVASTNQGEFLSHFSNYGANTVDITAPGENITVLNGKNTLSTINGTSFATPFVTSTLARYFSQNPVLTPEKAIQKVYSHSKENAKLYNIKNSLQLQLDPNSFSTSVETPVLSPIEPEPIDPAVPPVNPDPIDTPSGNSQELKEDYSKIMQEIALIRQGKISLQQEKKSISVQEVETLESNFQDFVNAETNYLQTRNDITEAQKQKYFSFLETQLTLVKQFNASYKAVINTGNNTQSTLTQQSFENITEDIFKELNIQNNSEEKVKILPNMSQFSFGDTNEVVEKVENIKLIQNKNDTNNSDISAQSFVGGYIPQSTVAVNINDVQDSAQVVINETIENLAAQLEYNPTKIYNYVRNNISYEAYYGSKRSSISCLGEGACNDVDQANVTLALLRASGIPARYKTNHIVVHKDKINQLFGVTDLKLSFHALLNAQVPTYRVNTTNNTGGKVKFSDIDFSQDEYIGLEWTNVEALIEYDHLAGNYSNELFLKGITDSIELNNKITEQGNLEWITMDPTFTFSEVGQVTAQSKDLLDESGLDLDTFYLDYLKSSQNTDVIQKLESDFQTNTPNLKNLSGTALEDEYTKYFYSKTPKQSQFEILPVSQYYVSGEFTLSDGTILGEKISSTLENKKVQKLQIEIKRESNNEVVLDHIYSVDEINNSPLTLDYFGTTQADRTTIENYGSIHLTPSDLVNLSLSIDTDATPHVQPLPTKSVKIGETLIMNFHYIVDGEAGNTSAKYTVGGNSEGIYMSFGKVSDDSLDTDSKVLLAGNWAIAKRYLQKIELASETLEKTLNIQNDIHYARAVVTQNRVLNTINGTPSTFEFKGLTLDANTLVKDYARSNYADNTLRTRLFRKIFGLYSSEQEGQIFNEITGLTGISTTKGLQYAYEHPAEYTIHTINSANKAVIDTLGYSANTKTAMKKYVDEGRTIITPDKFIQNKNWKGMFYIAVNSIGEAVYAIGERVVQNGGYTTDEFSSYIHIPIYENSILEDESLEDYFTSENDIVSWNLNGTDSSFGEIVQKYNNGDITLANYVNIYAIRKNGTQLKVKNILKLPISGGKAKIIAGGEARKLKIEQNNIAYYFYENNTKRKHCSIGNQKFIDVFNTRKYVQGNGYQELGLPCSYNTYQKNGANGLYTHHFINLTNGVKFRKNSGIASKGEYNYFESYNKIKGDFNTKSGNKNLFIHTAGQKGTIYQSQFEGSTYYYAPSKRTVFTTVSPGIAKKYSEKGTVSGNRIHYDIGFPIADSIGTIKEASQKFENGMIFSTKQFIFNDYDSYYIRDGIYKKYLSSYGYATSDEKYNNNRSSLKQYFDDYYCLSVNGNITCQDRTVKDNLYDGFNGSKESFELIINSLQLENLIHNISQINKVIEMENAGGYSQTTLCTEFFRIGNKAFSGCNWLYENSYKKLRNSSDFNWNRYLDYHIDKLEKKINQNEILLANTKLNSSQEYGPSQWTGYFAVDIALTASDLFTTKGSLTYAKNLSWNSIKSVSKSVAINKKGIFSKITDKNLRIKFSEQFKINLKQALKNPCGYLKANTLQNTGCNISSKELKQLIDDVTLATYASLTKTYYSSGRFVSVHWGNVKGHIINGGINRRGRAYGLHTKHGLREGQSRIVGNKIQIGPDGSGFYEATVDIKNTLGVYITKGQKSSFFPDSWGIEKIKKELDYAFDNIEVIIKPKPDGTTTNIYLGKTTEGYPVQFFIDENSWDVISAFPNFNILN